MIESLKIDPSAIQKKSVKQPYSWAKEVPFIKANPVISFKPGLNILFGPNGSGKSTIIGLCAHLLAAEQGGISTVTETWVRRAVLDRKGLYNREYDPHFAEVNHDGQAVYYLDPRKSVGLMGGGFDDDFFTQGVQNIFGGKQSSGQVSHFKAQTCIAYLLNFPKQQDEVKGGVKKGRGKKTKAVEPERFELPKEIDWRFKKDKNGQWCVNDVWSQALDQAESMLAPKCPEGPRTFLMDEPESGYSLVWQGMFWKNIMQHPAIHDKQVIVATHSPFALNIPDVNYIEMEEGYIDSCARLFKEQWG